MKYTFSIPEDTKQIIELETGMKIEAYLEKVKDDILDKQENGEKLTIKKAAQLMNVTPQFIRVGIQMGTLPFGWAVNISGKGKYTYYISPKKFTEHTGIKVPE